jgi:hypothetical protein
MTNMKIIIASIIMMVFSALFAGCAATSDPISPFEKSWNSHNPMKPGDSGNEKNPPPDGAPPAGAPPGAAPPGGNTGSSDYALSGAYTFDGETKSGFNGTFTSDTNDVSAIYITNGGTLTLDNPTIITTGDTSSNEASSFYGLNGAILANKGSTVVVNGGSISTIGTGANGVIPTGTGTSVFLSNLTIRAAGNGGHGVMATLGGSLILTDVDITTTGSNGAPIATDRGSGTVNVTRGIISSSGTDSPGIYSTGVITVRDAVITSEGTEAAVIEGFNTIHLINSTLSGGVGKTGGIMIYQSFSGDAKTGTGEITMNGGSYHAVAGPAFFVTNTDAKINLNGVNVVCSSNILIKAEGTSRWGNKGANGGIVTLTADGQTLNGSFITDEISSIDATLKNGSILTGVIKTAALTLDPSSTWNVTGDSHLTSLVGAEGVSDGSITNIIGNGYTVTYDKDASMNRGLGGTVYTLGNGGTLIPE